MEFGIALAALVAVYLLSDGASVPTGADGGDGLPRVVPEARLSDPMPLAPAPDPAPTGDPWRRSVTAAATAYESAVRGASSAVPAGAWDRVRAAAAQTAVASAVETRAQLSFRVGVLVVPIAPNAPDVLRGGSAAALAVQRAHEALSALRAAVNAPARAASGGASMLARPAPRGVVSGGSGATGLYLETSRPAPGGVVVR